MPTHEESRGLVAKARDLVAQHEKLYADHDLPIDVSDQILAFDDLNEETRSKLEQELMSSREAARAQEFASARKGRKHRPRNMI